MRRSVVVMTTGVRACAEVVVGSFPAYVDVVIRLVEVTVSSESTRACAEVMLTYTKT